MAKQMVAVLGLLVLGGCAMDAATEEDIALAEDELDSREIFVPTDPGLDPGGTPPPEWDPENALIRGSDPCPECRALLIPQASLTDLVQSYRVYVDLTQQRQQLGFERAELLHCQGSSCVSAPLPILETVSVPSSRAQFVYPTTSLTGRAVGGTFHVRYICPASFQCAVGPSAYYDTATARWRAEFVVTNSANPAEDRVVLESASWRWSPPAGTNPYDPAAVIIWNPPRIFLGI